MSLMLLAAQPLSFADTTLAAVYQFPAQWIDDTGKTVALQQYKGKPVVISMAYSTCRKFCPMTMARLNQIQQLYDKLGINADFVLISYDPSIDHWQTWAQYRVDHHYQRQNWHFLTGTPENTKSISELLGMNYWLYDDHVMHNFKIDLLDSECNIEKTLDWDQQQQIDTFVPNVFQAVTASHQ